MYFDFYFIYLYLVVNYFYHYKNRDISYLFHCEKREIMKDFSLEARSTRILSKYKSGGGRPIFGGDGKELGKERGCGFW